MTREEVFEIIKNGAIEIVGYYDDAILNRTRFDCDLCFDSLDKVEFIMSMEHKFSISIQDDDADKVVTIKDAVDLVCKILNIV